MEEAQLRERNVWELRGGVSLSALGAIVTHLGGLREGRKSVVFFSQGPPLGRLGGPNEERLREVLQAANRGNVTIHVIDPRPLGGGAPLGGTDALFRLYNETGGRAIINSNNPSQRLDGIISDASAYYLLGYTPARAFADGRFHRIDVTVKRRGVRVTARRGYWAPTEKETTAAPAAPVEPGLTDALAQLADPKAARPVDVWIGLSRGSGEQTRVSVTWEQGSTRDARQRAARLAVERLLSRSSTSAEERHVIGPTATGADSAVATFEVAGGNELLLRLTAETADGVIVDQWDQALRVPEFDSGALGLSTPRFLRARSAFEAQAMRAGQDPPPAASRQFRPSDRVMVEVECYAPVDAATTLSAQLLNGKGERLTDLTIPAPVDGRSRFVLPLSSLAPSTYVLRLDARAGDRDVQQRTAFRVVP
jgi:hypothetical protein